jgi:hypothetical protein
VVECRDLPDPVPGRGDPQRCGARAAGGTGALSLVPCRSYPGTRWPAR